MSGGMAQVVEHLFSKCEALSSNSSATKSYIHSFTTSVHSYLLSIVLGSEITALMWSLPTWNL
jgi:hypothetical protein